MTLTGHATPEGTARYAKRFSDRAAAGHFRETEDLLFSSIGIGTYLGNADEATDNRYIDAITRTVELGANVIDSAANYRFQRSERAIGRALGGMVSSGLAARDELVVCTKGGYIPFDGQPPRDVRAYLEETFVAPGIAKLSDFVGGSHCMTPAYLQNQIHQSLANLGLDCIDVYYIHNPESQLGAVSREEFDSRLGLAFAKLEENRATGKIRYYGVATWNGFRADPSGREYHSLERMVELATTVGGTDHGFRFIQLPFNFAMPEALANRNQQVQGEFESLLEAAADFGVNVIASASILQGRVAKGLSDDVRKPLGSLATDAQTGIQFVRSTPGLTTALVGMSKVVHVEENLELVGIPPASLENYARLFDQG